MDDIDKSLNQPAGEEASVSEATPEEPKATEEAQAAPTEPTGEVEETQAEPEGSSKKGASNRIRELNAKAKSAEERAKSLEQQIAELTSSGEPQTPQAPIIPQALPDGDLSPEQYRQHVLQTAEGLVNLKIKQSEAINRINNESQQVLRIYPQLDPDSEQFDQELSNSVTETVMELVKANPYTASPKKIVENFMKPYQRSVAKEVGKASENIAKQTSQAALRPTSVTTKGEKPDSELSIAEMEAKYGIVN